MAWGRGSSSGGDRPRRQDAPTNWMTDPGSGAEFSIVSQSDGRQTKLFRTVSDSERYHKEHHGDCPLCDGTGFEKFERGAQKWVLADGSTRSYPSTFVRRCQGLGVPLPPSRPYRDPSEQRGGFEPVRKLLPQTSGLKWDGDEAGGR